MLKAIIWSPLSENDFATIVDYLDKQWGTKVAIQFIDLIDNILYQISNNPRQFPVIYKWKKIRKCVLTKHNTLYYRDAKNRIEILRIYDTRQDPINLIFK